MIDLALGHTGITGKFQAVGIIDQITSVFGKIVRDLIIRTVLNLRYVGISPGNTVRGHHTDRIFQISCIFPVQIVTVLILFVTGSQCIHCQFQIVLQRYIVNPVTCMGSQLFLSVHSGVPVHDHGKIYGNCSVILPGYPDILRALLHEISKCQILQSICPLTLRNGFYRPQHRVLFLHGLFCFRHKFQLSVSIQFKMLRRGHGTEIIDEIRHTHDTVRIFHAVSSPLDQIFQFIDRRYRAVHTTAFCRCEFCNIDLLIGIKLVIGLNFPLDHHKL